jgi:hypothetical protein
MSVVVRIEGKEFEKATASSKGSRCVAIRHESRNVIIANTRFPGIYLNFTVEEWEIFKKAIVIGDIQ